MPSIVTLPTTNDYDAEWPEDEALEAEQEAMHSVIPLD